MPLGDQDPAPRASYIAASGRRIRKGEQLVRTARGL